MTNHIEKVLLRFLWAFLACASLSACAEEPDKRNHLDAELVKRSNPHVTSDVVDTFAGNCTIRGETHAASGTGKFLR